MSLYDLYKQAQTPYMSQYVGSPVSELSQYGAALQQRYNTAQDTDDTLAEGLNNLQHLNLDADTQYANELKDYYYNRLQERAGRGDFENMGRRTRYDAIKFAQAYQPLIQRQRDLAEIVKKVNSDPNIADPAKKQQILQYISHLNGTPRDENGDFRRDQNGRVQLGAIQDWAYAPDVDINKKLTDILSKKEADIRQSGFASDGQGMRISSIEELRSPAVMARLARQMMATDPEINAMFNRDVTLQNYALTPNQVSESLKGSDISPYQALKRQGLNDKQISVIAKHQGMKLEEMKASPIQSQRQQLINSGYSPEAADRAILNNITKQQMAEPHADFIGNLLSYDKRKLEGRDDPLFLLNAKHAMDQADNGSFEIMNTPITAIAHTNPGQVATDYTNQARSLELVRGNVNAATMQAMKQAGMATGDAKKDLAMAADISNDRTKLNALKDKLKATNPDLAGRLEVTQNNYLQAKNQVEGSGAILKSMEDKAGIDWDKLYKEYSKQENPLSKQEFINQVRDKNSEGHGFMAGLKSFVSHNTDASLFEGTTKLNDAVDEYQKKMKNSSEAIEGAKAAGDLFQTIEPTSGGYVKNATELVQNRTKWTGMPLREVGGDGKEGTLADLMGLNKNKLIDKTSDDYKQMDAADVRLNTRWRGGHPTLTVRRPDGSAKVFEVTDPNAIPMFKEITSRLIGQAGMNRTSDQAKSQMQNSFIGLGESTMNTSVHELSSYEPSAVKYPINDQFTVKVKAGGPFGKLYEVYDRASDQLVKRFTTPDDIAIALGYDEFKRIQATRK